MDFSEFFNAVHGTDKKPITPFPWQAELAEKVIDKGWPQVLDLPTGSGKTAALDIAVFHLIYQLSIGAQRTAPLRIFFVVDRRIVVDDAFRRARKLATALQSAQSGPLSEAKLLFSQFQGEKPLHVSVMRGGMYRDDGWTHHRFNQPFAFQPWIKWGHGFSFGDTESRLR